MLKALKPKEETRELIGFDTETADDGQAFVCCSFSGVEEKFIKNRQEAFDYLATLRGKIIVATNLPYDLFSLFKNREAQGLNMLWNGGRLLKAKTWSSGGKFYSRSPDKSSTERQAIEFWDTMNFAPFSVKKWGEILHAPKLKSPAALARFPESKEEWGEMRAYNMQDARISRDALRFLFDGFKGVGGVPRCTLASTSMATFRASYLDGEYWTPSAEDAREQFKAYYGGRCEAFARGRIENARLYDVNSLYPYVMQNFSFPHPNYTRIRWNDAGVIAQYPGVSFVKMSVPKSLYPLLPFPSDKLYFPAGIIEGCYTHVEIKEAIARGASLLHIGKSIYSKEECRPFDAYIKKMFSLRREYQEQGDARELIAKLLMNSLYGKFGQKFDGRENLVPCSSVSFQQLESFSFVERVGDFFRIKQDCRPACFCLPLWASYITAYARIELQKHIEMGNALYCDTDSVVTFRRLPSSSALGKLKEECRIDEGVIVRPKFYGFMTDAGERVKCKGYGAKMSYEQFWEVLRGGKVAYKKFVKLRESLRRHIDINRVLDIEKAFTLEDGKRAWNGAFNPETLAWSEARDCATIQNRSANIPIGALSPPLLRKIPL